jgi:hypothetical protein
MMMPTTKLLNLMFIPTGQVPGVFRHARDKSARRVQVTHHVNSNRRLKGFCGDYRMLNLNQSGTTFEIIPDGKYVTNYARCWRPNYDRRGYRGAPRNCSVNVPSMSVGVMFHLTTLPAINPAKKVNAYQHMDLFFPIGQSSKHL